MNNSTIDNPWSKLRRKAWAWNLRTTLNTTVDGIYRRASCLGTLSGSVGPREN